MSLRLPHFIVVFIITLILYSRRSLGCSQVWHVRRSMCSCECRYTKTKRLLHVAWWSRGQWFKMQTEEEANADKRMPVQRMHDRVGNSTVVSGKNHNKSSLGYNNSSLLLVVSSRMAAKPLKPHFSIAQQWFKLGNTACVDVNKGGFGSPSHSITMCRWPGYYLVGWRWLVPEHMASKFQSPRENC